MNNAPRIQANWRWPALIGLNLLAFALLLSWQWPATRALWEPANLWLFQQLNGSLGHVLLWDGFWAIASMRLFDILVGALLLVMTIHSGWVFSAGETRRALFHFIALLLLLVIVRSLFGKLVPLLGWQHASPSVQIAGAWHLSDQFPLLEQVFEIKDRSSRSFPGDHASVLLLWGLFMACFARGWKLLACLAVVALCCLPRLVAGAHWLVDIGVGGAFLALFAFAWGYCTPLAGWLAKGLEWASQPALRLARQLPVIRGWSLVRGAQSSPRP